MLNSPQALALKAHLDTIRSDRIADYFESNSERFQNFSVSLESVIFDYSKHHVNGETISLLMDLARSVDLEGKRDAMFSGAVANKTEGRAALHAALRGSVAQDLAINGENIAGFVEDTKAQMQRISQAIRSNTIITDVVNIGIGGSDIGPRIACEALQPFCDGPRTHFLANIDGQSVSTLLDKLKPESTVFIVSSKTFTTQETLMNANAAKAWLLAGCGEEAVAEHFYAVTSHAENAAAFGVAANHILPMRDWVGGRFSVWGAIGLPLAIAIGFDRFEAFLNGARDADTHFKEAPLDKNIPVLMAMLGIWYRNFWDYRAHCIVPYAKVMSGFSRYITQICMESNGKSAGVDGGFVTHKTAPISFGEPGTNAQHAFFQAFHQGDEITPVDFIAILNPEHDRDDHHRTLLSNALAQAQALMLGEAHDDPAHHFPGNRPSAMLMLDRLDPYHLGMLMAIYEHKVFVQGVIWGINSFDQMGVELGKRLAKDIEASFANGAVLESADASTQNLMAHILKKRL